MADRQLQALSQQQEALSAAIADLRALRDTAVADLAKLPPQT